MGSLGSKQIAYGLLFVVGGALLTLATSSTGAEVGGVYVIAYGAMFGGALELLIGFVNYIAGSQ